MKKLKNIALILWFTLLFCLLLLTIFSCTTAKNVTTKNEVKTTKDSIVYLEKSKAITDSLIIELSEIKTSKNECDSIVNEELKKFLKLLNVQKTSGNNTVGFSYDDVKQLLIAYAKVGETTNKKEKIKETTTDTTTTEVPVKYTPKWIKTLAYIGGFTLLLVLTYVAIKFIK